MATECELSRILIDSLTRARQDHDAMASERMLRRIEALLDEADRAIEASER